MDVKIKSARNKCLDWQSFIAKWRICCLNPPINLFRTYLIRWPVVQTRMENNCFFKLIMAKLHSVWLQIILNNRVMEVTMRQPVDLISYWQSYKDFQIGLALGMLKIWASVKIKWRFNQAGQNFLFTWTILFLGTLVDADQSG